MKTGQILLTLGAVGLFAAPVRAQLFVDIGGPRNIFVATAPKTGAAAKETAAAKAKTDATGVKDAQAAGETPAVAAAPGAAGSAAEGGLRFVTLDSKEKSVTLNFLGLPHHGGLVFGGLMTVAAQDELEEFLKFRKAPKIEGNVLANYTDHLGDRGGMWSVTVRLAASEAAYLLKDPVSGTTSSDTHRGMEGHATLACAVASGSSQFENNALALTFGYKPDTNYEALPLVDLGNGKSAREGTLERFKSYPLQLIYVRETQKRTAAWLDYLPQVDAKADKFFLISPYIKLTPREGGRTGQVYGLNLALKTVLQGKRPSENKTTYPYSIYVESTRRSGEDHFTTGAGVSTVFSF